VLDLRPIRDLAYRELGIKTSLAQPFAHRHDNSCCCNRAASPSDQRVAPGSRMR
jgi:hypothetical protein